MIMVPFHFSTCTLLHFTYRTPAILHKIPIPVTSIVNLREASNEVSFTVLFLIFVLICCGIRAMLR